ncbi:MAG: hypothetical protein HYY81_07475 [Deltaproteobacteria bacterium]|nr:hypothetical protein [Deltaproteobacteria bacterium]
MNGTTEALSGERLLPFSLNKKETLKAPFEKVALPHLSQLYKVKQGIADAPQVASSSTQAARLLDLSPWGYRLLAQQTQQGKGQEGRAFIYQGKGQEYLLAQEFERVDFSPPSGAGTIRQSGREFVSYSQRGVNLVAWKEKDLLCIIASTLSTERLLGLAQEIAMRG